MHVVRLETRDANVEGAGLVAQRDLVRNSLRMRPNRILVGEVRGAEALDMLQAMNTGHEGSLTTIHANDTRDALARLEMMVAMTGLELPILVVRQYIAAGIRLVVHLSRLQGGARKITRISEIVGMENGAYRTEDIFGLPADGRRRRRQRRAASSTPPAIGPACLERMKTSGAADRRRLVPAAGRSGRAARRARRAASRRRHSRELTHERSGLLFAA